ncbi:hypothetical protein ACA910_020579 [Epithemia clementina (nom. ined.)]
MVDEPNAEIVFQLTFVGQLPVLETIKVLLELENVLGWVYTSQRGAFWQFHEDWCFDLGLRISHHKIDGAHLPPEHKGENKDEANNSPGDDWGIGIPQSEGPDFSV